MNAKDKRLLMQLHNELQLERHCADLLAQALCEGGIDRQFEAMNNYELLRNGLRYSQQVKQAVAQKPKRQAKRGPRRSPNHPTQGYYIAGKDFNFGFDCKPFNQDEEQED